MVEAWCLSNNNEQNVTYLSIDKVILSTGVELHRIDDHTTASSHPTLNHPAVVERYDIILTDYVDTNAPPGDLNQLEYLAELEKFYKPHFHLTDEIRYIKDGGCFIDVLFVEGDWVRLHLRVGDLLVIPAGLYHRVSLDDNRYVKATGYFKSRGLGDDYEPLFDCEANHPVKTLYRQTLMSIDSTMCPRSV